MKDNNNINICAVEAVFFSTKFKLLSYLLTKCNSFNSLFCLSSYTPFTLPPFRQRQYQDTTLGMPPFLGRYFSRTGATLAGSSGSTCTLRALQAASFAFAYCQYPMQMSIAGKAANGTIEQLKHMRMLAHPQSPLLCKITV